MAHEEIILQVIIITIVVYFARMAFNKFFGLSGSERRDLMQKSMDLQKNLNEAMGDPNEVERLQKEAMELMQQMLKKQMIPMCISCITFLVLWAILGIVYMDFSANSGLLPFPVLFFGDGWEGLYVLTSFSLVGISFLIRYIYKKAKGIESGPGLLSMLSAGAGQSASQSLMFSTAPSASSDDVEEDKKSDAWKEKLKK